MSDNKNIKYWRKRFEQNQENILKPADDYIIEVERIFKEASKEIEKEIALWYQRFADNNGIIDTAEARKRLKAKEFAELKWNVDEYIKHGRENGISSDWSRELENASARVHISRLEALELQCKQYIENLYTSFDRDTGMLLENIYKESMYHTAYEFSRGTGIGTSFAAINIEQLKRVISKPWSADGRSFSQRIWGEHRAKLVDTLHNRLSRGILTGKSPDKIIDEIAKVMKSSKNRASRLVMTESAYFASLAQKESFKKLGVKKYQILGTLDSGTCEDCGNLDGKVIELKEFEVAATAPPFHCWCRCTMVPFFDDEFTEGEKRFARDKDGNAVYVPADMTYEEWKEKFVDNLPPQTDQSDIGKKIKNIFNSSGLKHQLKEFDESLESVKNQDVKILLEQSRKRVRFVKENNRGSRFSRGTNTIYLNELSTNSTIAHELFHEIDSIYGITESGLLKNEIQKDWKRIKNYAEGYGTNIENMLYLKYPNAFKKTENGMKIKEEFRGISDILNGMSKCNIGLGYGHKLEYWEKPLKLEKETWAQFGRILYDNNPEVLNMTEFLFGNIYSEILRILKGMIK